MRTSLFSSSTERPVVEMLRRLGPLPDFSTSWLRAWASTITSLPSWLLTTIPPLMRLALTSAGRDGSVRDTERRSAPDDDCAFERGAASARLAAATAVKNSENRCLRLFMVFEDTNVSIEILHLNLRAAGTDTHCREALCSENMFPSAAFL